MPETEITQ